MGVFHDAAVVDRIGAAGPDDRRPGADEMARAGGEGAPGIGEGGDRLGLAVEIHRPGRERDVGRVGDLIGGQPLQRAAADRDVAADGIDARRLVEVEFPAGDGSQPGIRIRARPAQLPRARAGLGHAGDIHPGSAIGDDGGEGIGPGVGSGEGQSAGGGRAPHRERTGAGELDRTGAGSVESSPVNSDREQPGRTHRGACIAQSPPIDDQIGRSVGRFTNVARRAATGQA